MPLPASEDEKESAEVERAFPDDSFDPKTVSRRLLQEARTGALATIAPDGFPFASLVTVATEPNAAPILLLSRLALHTRNLEHDARASLLVAAPAAARGDALASARLTAVGRACRLDEAAVARRRFLARHPEAAVYADFPDFGFWRLDLERAHLVAGFGRIFEIPASDLAVDTVSAQDVLGAEEGAVRHMNEDHSDAVRLYATRLLGEEDGRWRVIGIDPAGVDLALGGIVRRLDFPEKVESAGALRRMLARLAEEARGRGGAQ